MHPATDTGILFLIFLMMTHSACYACVTKSADLEFSLVLHRRDSETKDTNCRQKTRNFPVNSNFFVRIKENSN